MSDDDLYEDQMVLFCVNFTRAVIEWNKAERSAIATLVAVGGGSVGMLAVANNLGNIALKDALISVATHLSGDDAPASTELFDHVRHFVEGMDVLRAYRNFYVHSMVGVGKLAKSPTDYGASLHAIEAKGRIAWIEHNLTMKELMDFAEAAHSLSAYGRAIADYVGPHPALGPKVAKTPLSSLEKPTWPGRLKKHREYLGSN